MNKELKLILRIISIVIIVNVVGFVVLTYASNISGQDLLQEIAKNPVFLIMDILICAIMALVFI